MTRRPPGQILFGIVISWLGVGGAWASDSEILAVKTQVAPKIDGRLDDACWKTAAVVGNYTQRSPFEGEPATEPTIVRVCYDAEHLYVAMRCYDSQPKAIRATVMQRDQTVGADDFAYVLLDPYRRGRDGYYFRTNPNGVKGDGLISPDTTRVRMEWDAIWRGASQMDGEGWTTEMAIPFRSLSFDENQTSWGINFGRAIPRNQERSKWVGASLNRAQFGLAEAGVIHGLEGLKRGLGVDFKPYISMSRRSVKSGEQREFSDFDVGGDVFYQVTPSLTATFTVNTDFAEAEVDQRRVNLTRFPLFFPEKRDFFLEGSEHFGFGGLLKSPLAFHSRNIGLSADGEKVDILGGAKLTGRQGPIGIGMLGMWLDDLGELQSDQVFVGRLTYDILDQSKAGAIFTHGDPRANADNQLAGFDLNLRETNWIGDQSVSLHTFYMQSDDSEAGAGSSYGVRASYPNRPVRLFGQWMRVEEEFEPGVGFVRRPGRDLANLEGRYAFYPPNRDVIDDMFLGFEWFRFTEIASGALETDRLEGPTFSVDSRVGDEVGFGPVFEHEVLFEPFNIVDNVVIPAGDYEFNNLRAFWETSSSRPVFLEAEAKYGQFFSGQAFATELEIAWRPSRFVQFDVGGEWTDASLETGEFETVVGFVNFLVTPNRRLSWNTLLQFDNVSDQVGINSRIRYILRPGSDLFFVFNKGFDAEDGRFRGLSNEAIGKLGWTFRF